MCEFCAGEKHHDPKMDDDHHNETMAFLLRAQWWYSNPKPSFNEFDWWLSTGVITGQRVALDIHDSRGWTQSLDHRAQWCKKMTRGLLFI